MYHAVDVTLLHGLLVVVRCICRLGGVVLVDGRLMPLIAKVPSECLYVLKLCRVYALGRFSTLSRLSYNQC